MAFKNLGFDLESIEDHMGSNLRLFISFTIGLIVFVGLIALSVFFIAIRGKEEVMVPDVMGKELAQALIELQEKELYPRISLRSSADGQEKGIILEQNPEAGTLVKAERRINLVISSGLALDKMVSFLGKNINDVRLELQAFNANSSEIQFTIHEPFMYQYSNDSAAGTVLQQNPPPGADLTGSVVLELVVSRGRENTRITVPDLTGLTFTDALARLGQLKIGFNFIVNNTGEKPGTVISQNPVGGTEISTDQKVTVTIIAPQAENSGETVGLFSYNLPLNPYPLPLTVETELPNGSKQTLVNTNHSGGEFSMPYKLPSGSVIILSMVDREIYRQTIRDTAEE
ncbi:MAG: PASTA domain-containing protein [Treponema sp.]|nr:PASTA domain-containing protein [Treponema sp.]